MLRNLTAGAILIGCALAADARVLRYQFEPGDWLVYAWRSEWTGPGAEMPVARQAGQMQIWCLARDHNAYLLLIDRIRVLADGPEPIAGVLVWIDNRGRRRPVPETAHQIPDFDRELDLLPILPTALADPGNWTAGPDHFGRTWRGAAVDSPDGDPTRAIFTLELVESPALAPLLTATRSGTLTFDRKTGHVVAARFTTTTPSGRSRIDEITRHRYTRRNAVWRTERENELDRYRLMRRIENAMIVRATEPRTLAEIAERVPRIWDEYLRGFAPRTDSPLARLAAGRSRRLAERPAQLQDAAAPLALWIGQPAHSWTLPQNTGGALRSEDLRTGVTFEWFYSAAVPASLYVAPAIAALAGQLPESVRVIAYNVDNDPRRAAQTAARLAPGLTHVLAAPLRESENLTILPAFRVIDAAGITRTAALGWRTDFDTLLTPVIGHWKPGPLAPRARQPVENAR